MTDFTRARAVADAVLFEGYLLYPYRASAPKNRARWQFGVVAPRAWSEATRSDPWSLEASCLIALDGPAEVTGELRFLHLRRRLVERSDEGHPGAFRPVESLELDGQLHVAWDEAEVRDVALRVPAHGESHTGFVLPAHRQVEPLADRSGEVVARLVREIATINGTVQLSLEPVAADHPLCRLRLRVENHSDGPPLLAPRDQAMGASLLGTHLLLAVEGGRFLSLTDPPGWAAEAAAECRQGGLYPVLVEGGAPGQDVLLAAPFILSDHPQVAPQSQGDFYDATEIDELLTLRTLTLSDEEKRHVRATDARARAILERVEGTSPEALARMHGVLESREIVAGSRVRLRPGARRTDAQDMFLAGKLATVEVVLTDVDGRACFAVTLDDDPASALFRVHGRYLYFYADEVERA
jgi:hypothetical protein